MQIGGSTGMKHWDSFEICGNCTRKTGVPEQTPMRTSFCNGTFIAAKNLIISVAAWGVQQLKIIRSWDRLIAQRLIRANRGERLLNVKAGTTYPGPNGLANSTSPHVITCMLIRLNKTKIFLDNDSVQAKFWQWKVNAEARDRRESTPSARNRKRFSAFVVWNDSRLYFRSNKRRQSTP